MIYRLAGILDVDANVLFSAVAESEETTNVILVDDEEIILKSGMPILEEVMPNAANAGFSNPREAVEYARNKPVALAFLDIEMGRVSGHELCRALLKINPRTNLVFLTGYRDYSLDAWETGACGFLMKPLTTGPRFALSPKFCLCFESLLSGTLIPLMTVYLLRCTGEDWRKSGIFYLVFALFTACAALLTVTQFTTFIYYYTPDNVYHLGTWYPLLITIHTRRTEGGSEIVVEDNGPGYASPDDGEPHIALNNIRERLALMCGGSLSIAEREGGGTAVTVTVPDSAASA